MKKILYEKEMVDVYKSILLSIQEQLNKMRKANIDEKDMGGIIVEGITASLAYIIDKVVKNDLIIRQIIIDGINQKLKNCILKIDGRNKNEKTN